MGLGNGLAIRKTEDSRIVNVFSTQFQWLNRSAPRMRHNMGKKILVIGGAGGIGKKVSKALLENGHVPILADLNQERLRKAAEELGRDTRHFQVDVRNEASVAKLVSEVVSAAGRIDSLFALHGVTSGREEVFKRSLAEWKFVLDTNLTGTFLCIKHAAPVMIRQASGGCIVALTTTRAKPEDAPYYSSKIGIEGLVATSAEDLKKYRIGVFVVSPGGYLSTDFHDHSYELMKYPNFVPDEEMRSQRRAIKPDVVVPLLLHLSEKIHLDLAGKKITAIDWNEANGLGHEEWYSNENAV